MRELKYLLIIGTIDVVESSEAIEIPHSTDILIKTIIIFLCTLRLLLPQNKDKV